MSETKAVQRLEEVDIDRLLNDSEESFECVGRVDVHHRDYHLAGGLFLDLCCPFPVKVQAKLQLHGGRQLPLSFSASSPAVLAHMVGKEVTEQADDSEGGAHALYAIMRVYIEHNADNRLCWDDLVQDESALI